tara:strand:+ start:628 stop:783 length:156 start_codon:yes stop_codon:yes gene_type:complete
MANTYIIIEDGIVINRILADNIIIAKRTATENKVVVEDNDNNFMIGDTYTE